MADDPTQTPSGTEVHSGIAGGGTVVAPGATRPDTARPDTARRRRRSGRWLVELLVIVAVALVLTVVLRSFVVQTFKVPSGSMLPTLQIGDRITVDKLSYDFHAVHRGDIVVFKCPPLENPIYPFLVKRVVGLPGETISTRNGQVYIDGKLLSEPWLPKGPQSYTGALPGDAHPQFNMPGPVKIPAGEYYVMGDNRTDSEDSRFFGPITKSSIVGRAVAVVWPPGQIKGL